MDHAQAAVATAIAVGRPAIETQARSNADHQRRRRRYKATDRPRLGYVLYIRNNDNRRSRRIGRRCSQEFCVDNKRYVTDKTLSDRATGLTSPSMCTSQVISETIISLSSQSTALILITAISINLFAIRNNTRQHNITVIGRTPEEQTFIEQVPSSSVLVILYYKPNTE